MSEKRFFEDEGFLLQPVNRWREYDGRLIWFGGKAGCIDLNIFGVFGKSRRRAAILQLFHRLNIHWEHRGDYPVGVVKSVDLLTSHKLETPLKLACGSYINELVRRCYKGVEECHWEALVEQMNSIFATFFQIETAVQAEKPIRQFEANLLSMQGYTVYEDFPTAEGRYRYSLEGEWIRDEQGLSRNELKGLQKSQCDLWQTPWDDDFRLRIKRMHRLILSELFGNQPMQVREFFGKGAQ